jgi:hypothetical protein
MCLHCTCLIRNGSVVRTLVVLHWRALRLLSVQLVGCPVSCRCGAAVRCIRRGVNEPSSCKRIVLDRRRKRARDSNQAPGGSLFLRRSTGRAGNEQIDPRSHHGEHFRAYDGETGRGGHPTARWQDKSRKVRRGRGAQERRKIRHFTQCATRHDSVSIRTSTWKIDTSCTLCASAS